MVNKEIRAAAFVRDSDTNGTRAVADEKHRLPAWRRRVLEKQSADREPRGGMK